MNLIQKFMTKNDCFKAGRKITPKGIMVHSTATPGVMAEGWFSRWNKSYKAGEIDRQVCVHAFLDDKEVFQYLPWNHRGWHSGAGANNTHIGFEICEPKNLTDKEYFQAAWNNAVELAVFLCKQYNLKATDIISHKEGYKKGIASNHGDPDHWWKLHNKAMDDFRRDVSLALNPPSVVVTAKPKNIKEVQAYLNSKINSNLSIDGSYGPLTRKTLIKYWQEVVGGLDVDGSFGPKSKAKAYLNNLEEGDKGELVKIMQMALICKAHDLSPYGADGSFGKDTENEMKAYQEHRGLKNDGICGSKTWASLLS